jgi:hypothetical protein
VVNSRRAEEHLRLRQGPPERRLEKQLALIVPEWSMAPVVEAYQAMRGAGTRPRKDMSSLRVSNRRASPISVVEHPLGGESIGCAELGAERETTVDQTLIRGLATAFRVFVSPAPICCAACSNV